MASIIKFYELQHNQLNSLPIVEGNLIFINDTKQLYFDKNDASRILLSADSITNIDINGTEITLTKQDGSTEIVNYNLASNTIDGLMSKEDKAILDNISAKSDITNPSNELPKYNGNAAAGVSSDYARGDHVHPTQEEVAKLETPRKISLSDAVEGETTFDGTKDVNISVTLNGFDASKITSGTIDIARLPAASIERMKTVLDDTARFNLTKAEVQIGDTVKVVNTSKMYMVKDDNQLNNENGYEEFVVGSAAVAAECTGNAATATKLQNKVKINDTLFDGSEEITTDKWGAKREIKIISGNGEITEVDGKTNIELKLPSEITADLDGNAKTATAADKTLKDNLEQQIDTTYIKSLAIDGTTLTYTKGDGTEGTLTTQDTNDNDNTTYELEKEDNIIKLVGSDGTETTVIDDDTKYDNATPEKAGLMSAEDKAKFDWMEQRIKDLSATQNKFSEISDYIYPVGAIYMSVNQESPQALFGGQWELFSEGKVLVGVDANNPNFAGSMSEGGAQSIILDINQLPSHRHIFTGSSHNHTIELNHTHNIEGASHSHSVYLNHDHYFDHKHTYDKADSYTYNRSLNIAQMPSHNHQIKLEYGWRADIAGVSNTFTANMDTDYRQVSKYKNSDYWRTDAIINKGSGQGHNHQLSYTSYNTSLTNGSAYVNSCNNLITTLNASIDGTVSYTNLDGTTSNTQVSGVISYTGNGEAIDNMPPFVTCFIWRRIA